MNSRQQVESKAIVLDCRDHGESDIIVTFFCRHYGRITGIAKGAKRSKKRFVNKLEIFSSLSIVHTTPQNNRLAFIYEADLLDGFITLRENISCYTTASVICEFTLLATKEIEGDEELHPLLIWAYSSLNTNRTPLPVLIVFLMRFYTIIGYSPQLSNCIKCGRKLPKYNQYSFDTNRGGIHCYQCNTKKTSTGLTLSRGTINSLMAATQRPLERLHQLQFSSTIQKEALAFLHAYGYHLFQREIVSWSFLDSSTNPALNI